jgi:hypothetical protein
MTKKTGRFLLLPLAAAILSGCVKEKLEECFSGLALRYHYALNPSDTNAFGSDINELVIHAFDSRGIFYEEFVFDDPADLTENHIIRLPLPDGKWSIVTWGSESGGAVSRSYDMGTLVNDERGPSYSQGIEKGVTNLEEARLWIKNHTEAEDGRRHVADKLSRLYHASIYDVEATTSIHPVDVIDVPMMQNTNTLRVVVKGLPQPLTRAASDDFTVTADMVNGHYRHNNLLCSDGLPLKYQNGEWEETGQELQHDLTVLRPFVDDTVSELKLSIPMLEEYGYPDGEIAVPIVPTIMQSPDYNEQRDLDRANLYIFEFEFEIGDDENTIGLKINGKPWKVVDVIVPEL